MHTMTNPDWLPLEALIGDELAPDFMYMGTEETPVGTIHSYKHIDTRRYLHLDDEGNPYLYRQNHPDRYVRTSKTAAISYAFS